MWPAQRTPRNMCTVSRYIFALPALRAVQVKLPNYFGLSFFRQSCIFIFYKSNILRQHLFYMILPVPMYIMCPRSKKNYSCFSGLRLVKRKKNKKKVSCPFSSSFLVPSCRPRGGGWLCVAVKGVGFISSENVTFSLRAVPKKNKTVRLGVSRKKESKDFTTTEHSFP